MLWCFLSCLQLGTSPSGGSCIVVPNANAYKQWNKREGPSKAFSFEEALAELDKVVAQLESGQAPLEQSIALYTRGAALKAHCEEKLKAAQLQIEKITLDESGMPAGVTALDAE